MSAQYDVVIVGAGHAGAQTAMALRQLGHAGSIAIVGQERDLPYERPALSKDYLAGKRSFERMLIRPASFWQERTVHMLLGSAATKVNAARHRLVLADGRELEYGSLVWATGGSPRRLSCSGRELAGVHAIRTRADVDRLAEELALTRSVVIVGGGYIGLEAAAVLVERGVAVTIVEAQDRVLARVAGADLSRFYENEHRRHGVDLRLQAAVACLEGDRRVSAVRLADGTVLPADLVIVGIGIEPAVGPLLAAGARGGDGVAVDEYCRTNLPDVYAVGDCACHPNPFADAASIRLESVQNATDQATTAARAIIGQAEPYVSLPWFWSHQYDLRLQTAGLSRGHDTAVVRGDPASRSFSVAYSRAGRLIAIDCVNSAKDFVQGRKLVMVRAAIPPVLLADVRIPLQELQRDVS